MFDSETITVDTLHAMLGTGGKQLLDVRPAAEFEKGHVSGFRNVPVDALPSTMNELDKSQPVILLCTNGKKARLAASMLREAGFRDVRTVAGGLLSWKVQCFPLSKAN